MKWGRKPSRGDHVIMWSCGHVVLWSCGHVVLWSCGHIYGKSTNNLAKHDSSNDFAIDQHCYR
jgi:hypothetical protein